LSRQEKRIIRLRYGINGGVPTSPKTLDEIGEDYHLTRKRIVQIEADGLRRIRDYLEKNPTLKSSLRRVFYN
jgi:DNA-directed RNA polymerase sigma subunit (sigma70/sigma32)